ncbi:MAG: hypothetical protein ACTSQO_14675 [Candidatus Helarchaeota archaeon]
MWEITEEELLRLKCQQLFVPLIYSEVVARIIDRWPDNVEKKLREFGRRIGKGILSMWIPKNTDSVKSIVQETYKFLLKQKAPVEMKKDGRTLILRDKKCILCWEVTNANFHYCTPYGSLLETFVNKCRETNPKLPKIWVETTKSRAKGDNYCEHVIHILEE